MRKSSWLAPCIAVAFALVLAPAAHGEPILWGFGTFVFPGTLKADVAGSLDPAYNPFPWPGPYPPPPGPTTGTLALGGSAGDGVNKTNITVASIYASSSSAAATPDVFTKQTFSVVVGILDKDSNKSGLATFVGTVDGELWLSGNNLDFTFDKMKQTLHLGHYLYDIRLREVAPPGAGYGVGAITAEVKVRHNPEPSAVLLAALGLPLLSARYLRRKRRAPERKEN